MEWQVEYENNDVYPPTEDLNPSSALAPDQNSYKIKRRSRGASKLLMWIIVKIYGVDVNSGFFKSQAVLGLVALKVEKRDILGFKGWKKIHYLVL